MKSLSAPENTLTIAAVASPMPSSTATVGTDAPSVAIMNTGRRLWINSDERSMNSEPNPMAQMARGKARYGARAMFASVIAAVYTGLARNWSSGWVAADFGRHGVEAA